jgi:thiol-disulfide isomerase/thioredoxin
MRVRPTLLAALLLPVVLLGVAACGSSGPPGSAGGAGPALAAETGGPSAAAAGAASSASPAGASATPYTGPVPDTLKFSGTTLDGSTFNASSLAGRPVVLWFWAPWCATCFGQAPSVAKLAKDFSGRVNWLGVAGLDKSVKEMDKFVSEGEVGNVTHLNDQAGTVWKKFGIKEQSTFVMINRSGKVMQTGWLDSVTLSDWITYLDKH